MELCHYTNLEAFKSIIESEELWAQSFYYMNDTTEYRWIIQILNQYSNKYYLDLHKIFSKIISKLENMQNQSIPYLISFSSKKNDLNQWRSYSKDGIGVCMVFENYNKLPQIDDLNEKKALEFDILKKSIQNWSLAKVNYIDPDKDFNFLSFISRFIEAIHMEEKYDEKDQIFFNLIVLKLWLLSISIKHFNFNEELEYRIFKYWTTNTKLLESSSVNKNDRQELKYFVNNDNLRSYLSFKYKDYLSLKEVILGPKYLGSILDVEWFLQKNSLKNVKVIKSNVPYR